MGTSLSATQEMVLLCNRCYCDIVLLKKIASVGSYDSKGLKSVKSIDISSKGELIVA